jgi:hypothetical protein
VAVNSTSCRPVHSLFDQLNQLDRDMYVYIYIYLKRFFWVDGY